MLSRTRMAVPYEYRHMGRPIRVWANIRIWGRTVPVLYSGPGPVQMNRERKDAWPVFEPFTKFFS